MGLEHQQNSKPSQASEREPLQVSIRGNMSRVRGTNQAVVDPLHKGANFQSDYPACSHSYDPQAPLTSKDGQDA